MNPDRDTMCRLFGHDYSRGEDRWVVSRRYSLYYLCARCGRTLGGPKETHYSGNLGPALIAVIAIAAAASVIWVAW